MTRRASLDAVLGYAWHGGEFTATDALQSVGLTRSTTIDAIDELVAIGLLEELPNARAAGEYRKGRPARRFCLRADAGVVVGIDAGHRRMAVTVADLRGDAVAHACRTLDLRDDGADSRRRAVVEAVSAALEDAGRSRSEIVALCAGVPAPVNRHGESPSHPAGFWQRMNPDLGELLAQWAPYVRIENDASLAAAAEGAVGAAAGCRDYVALLAGARLGAGVVIDGHLLKGAHGGVGEMLAFDHVEEVHGAIGLGHRAAQWAREAIAEGRVDPDGLLAALDPDDVDGRRVLELAAQGDPDAQLIADRVGLMLARIVSVLGSMYDPSRVIVCGAISAGIGAVVETARGAFPAELDLPAPELHISQLGVDIVTTGAVVTALDLAHAHALDLRLAESA